MQEQQEKRTNKSKKLNLQGPVATVFESEDTGSWRLERPKVDFDQCIKCGICASVCPVDIVEIRKDEKEAVVFNFDYCKGCGICANECPKQCISMVPERGEL